MTDTLTAEERYDLLIRTGEALYGNYWQSAVARYLKISVRTMQRWVAGEFLVPIGVLRDLAKHCGERTAEIEKMREELVERLPTNSEKETRS